jgi:hypothetical protein
MTLVDASPSKRFFVEMLTRDIELKDAILDLLDNCVDGVLRILAAKKARAEEVHEELPYDGYWARITATADSFELTDNCGGMSRKIAIESAFRLGRVDPEKDKNIPTVGMYGIGMKRAIFKLGQYTRVDSYPEEDPAFFVEITPEWLTNDSWQLALADAQDTLDDPGVKISVRQLYDHISVQFDEARTTFLKELREEVASLYALIIRKGFKVYLNDKEIQPISLSLLSSEIRDGNVIQPYGFRDTYDGVDIEIVVGFYQSLASSDEIEDEQEMARKADNAGWTIICNDRVVLSHDKSPITGWGDPVMGTPKYHNQFISIAGVVKFISNEPLKLPLNTTKRGLNTSSFIYLHALPRMKEGLKLFTSFTNQWKGREQEASPLFQVAIRRDAVEVAQALPNDKWKGIRGSTGSTFLPQLPRPAKEERQRRIVFFREKQEIAFLGEYLFSDPDAPPSDVGIYCFEDVLRRAREETKENT